MRAAATGVRRQQFVPRAAATAANVRRRAVTPANTFAIFLILVGLILPANEIQPYIGGAKFTVGRIGIFLLFVPAVVMMFKNGRQFLATDFFAIATGLWIPIANIQTDPSGGTFSSAAIEGIEFTGGYLAARAFIFGPAAVHTFIRILKVFAYIAVAFAIADSASGRLITHDTVGSIFGTIPIEPQYRMGMVRAASTLDHAILFGAFCSLCAAIFLYAESNPIKRIVNVGVCLLGGILSLSSAGLLAFVLIVAAYIYDQTMKSYPWRWKAFWAGVATVVLVVMVAANHPLGWVISHLTLEPESGYFRILEWNAALDQIPQSPWVGFSFNKFGEFALDKSIDCVWLLFSLRFGVPTIAFLLLSNLTAILGFGQSTRTPPGNSYMDRMGSGFSLALLMFIFMGLTVHYWNYMWIFWGVCIGIRASLREYTMANTAQPVAYSRPVSTPARS